MRETQIREQNYEVEIFPKKNEILVSRGQIIGISGNTGSSTAPHLHFELRDTKTEHALNPLVYGFDLPDHKKPEIRGVKVYSLSKDGYRYPELAISRIVTNGKSGLYISENKISVPANYLTESGGLGFSFDVIDRLDGAANQCGLYGSILLVNGDTLFGQQIDRVPFESSRYVNCHTDYEEYSVNKKKYHKSFRTRENDLPVYLDKSMGILKAKPGETYKIHFIAYDVQGNRSELQFDLIVLPGLLNKNERLAPDLSYLQPSQSMQVEQGNTAVEFGVATVYEPLKIDQEKIGRSIGQRELPVHKAYRISINNSDKQDGKHYLEMITAKGSRKALKIKYEAGMITCESMYFGSYSVKRDTIPPTITPVNFAQTSTSYSAKLIQWKISDSGIGLADYDLFIDGQWKLLEYEYKTGMVTFTRDASIIGEKDILVRVKDDCGNVKEWKTRLTFK